MTVPFIDTIATWHADPAKAKTRPTVVAVADGPQAVLSAGSFAWRLDLPAAIGGSNAAPSPTAALLGALAGCAVVFIRDTLAPQLGIEVEQLRATASCDADLRGLLGIDGVSPALQDLRLAIEIAATPRQIDDLISVWQARCPIHLALQAPVPVTLSVFRP